ncbi:bactofilin family protein [Vallitalea okinawensis]|uniref:hypothetical protein n=1 Tax=Vallitalea okinawensis TaxID=2078660 RepID=UPI000CFD717E|nr:hypothetical protein [Vallitalea okinawensis]
MDLKINDNSQVQGGNYNDVKVNGNLVMNGNSEMDTLKINGNFEQEGHVKVQDELKINGSANFHSEVTAGEAKINGDSKFMGSTSFSELKINGGALFKELLTAKEIKVNGELRSEKNIETEYIKINGSLMVQENVEAENFRSNGEFTIEGLLNSDVVEIIPNRHCTAKEIGGRFIRIGSRNMRYSSTKFLGNIQTEVIEGDLIDLTNTTSKIVRGDKVVIRDNCNIDKVEYKTSLNVVGNGRVKESSKIGG